MKRMKTGRRIAAWLLALVMVLSLLPTPAFAKENNLGIKLQSSAAIEGSDYDGYIVKMKPSASVSLLSTGRAKLEVISKNSNLYHADSIEQIENTVPLSEIECIEPNYKLQLLDCAVNDTLYANGVQWNLDAMKAPAAWKLGQYGLGITVAVIDSGLFGIGNGETHEDIDPEKVVKPYNFLDKNTNVTDTRGHGTYVAGSIFAKTNNGAGIAGIMPEVKIMPLKVFSQEEAENADVIAAIDYAVENGADVINLSLGGKSNSELLKEACDRAVKAGLLVVAAAGNDGTSEPIYPAAYDSVIGVAALTQNNGLYEKSQYGQSVFTAAPGANIACVDCKANLYCFKTGTSLASPAVAALGAMAKSIKHDINQDGFKELIKQTSTDLGEKGFDIFYGYGAINFETAANKLLGNEVQTHTYGPWKSNGDTTHIRECTEAVCAHKETELHTWDSGKAEKNGITYTCPVCGQTRVSVNPVSDVWEYELVDEGTAVKLTKYIGTQTNVIVPSKLKVGEQELPVTTIGNETFLNSDIFWIELPYSITKVEDGTGSPTSGIVGAFAFCKNLTVVKLSPNMKKIADYMFYDSGSDYRMELTIPNGITEIGDFAFTKCNSLTELTLPASVQKIGGSAFYQSRRLAALNMPGVTTIEADAFTETVFEESYENKWKTGEFTGIVYAGKVAYLYFGPYTGSQDSPKYDPSSMPKDTELVLEDGTLGISEFLFSSHYVNRNSCKNNLKSITVPETIKYIPNGFFKGFGAVQEPDFKGVDMYGFTGTYAQTYANLYDNIRFHAVTIGDKPGYDSAWYDNHKSETSFLINTAAELWCFNDIVGIGEVDFEGKTVKIGKDIDVGGLTASGYGVAANRWDALGNFKGTLDGQGHTISGIYIDNSSSDYQGFFSQLGNTCIIRNLHLKGKVSGCDYTGGVVGKSAGATIIGCSFDGTVTGGRQYGYIGGIAGFCGGTLKNCKTYGTVTCKLNKVNETLLTGATGGIAGYTGGCTIENCENTAAVTGNAYSTGGIAGQMIGGAKIIGCTNSGAVKGMQFVGGVAGRVTTPGIRAVTNSINNGNVAGTTYAGGIVGTIAGNRTSAEECINNGAVSAKNYAAGILGYSEAAIIKKCCNTGGITAAYSAAGIIAKDSGFGVEDSYNLGNITATANNAGGITAFANNADNEGGMINCYNMGRVTAADGAAPLGNVYNNGDIFKNCYYLADKESNTVLNRTAKTVAAFERGEVAYLLGNSYGQAIGTDRHPVFRTEKNAVLTDGTNYYNEGQTPSHTHKFGEWNSCGTENHMRTCACGKTETAPHTWDDGVITKPATETETGVRTYTCTACGEKKTEEIPVTNNTIRIGTLKELQNFADSVSGGNNFKDKMVLLTADIDASSVDWNPVGYYTSATDYKDFAGTFDGQGHAITIKANTTDSYQGVFAYNSGNITNLVVKGSLSGGSYLGGVCGYNAGTITRCSNYASVTGSGANVAGIAGYSKAIVSLVENCANFGEIQTTISKGSAAYAGGIVGQTANNATVSGCYNTGTVTANKGYTGGIVGYAMGGVMNCYNTGAVSSNDEKAKTIGGIAGGIMGNGNIQYCYNIGTVKATNTAAIVGTGTAKFLSSNYYLSDSAKFGVFSLASTDGLKSADEMKKADFAKTMGSAFKTDYAGANTLNNGYPILEWQRTPVCDSSISPTAAVFDKCPGGANHKDISVTIALNGNTLNGVKNGSTPLLADSDYTITGDSCKIRKEYLKTLSTGTVNLSFDFSAGTASVLTVTVSDTTPANPGAGPSSDGGTIEVNGQKQDVGTSSTHQTDGQTVTIIRVDDTKLEKLLGTSGKKPTITLPASKPATVVIGELSGQTVKNLEARDAKLEFKTETVVYTLPVSHLNIEAVSSQLGSHVKLNDIKVNVKIGEAPADTVKIVQDSAARNSYKIIVKPVDFEITCTSGDKIIHINKFSSYVERRVAIPDGADPSKITTGVTLNADGSFRHVPTSVVMIDGRYYAKINSLTNSTYSVIWNPAAFVDTKTHWAQTAIDDMGARMIVSGVGSGRYEPDRSVTRAEFAAITVRAMGLAQGTAKSSFTDVALSDWFNGYVDTSVGYGLITGYSAESFGPNDTITREQAMTIIARAMKLMGLRSSITDSKETTALSKYTDGAAVSEFAKDSVAACLQSGIIEGSSATTLSPKSNVTRAEVAVMVQRLLKKSGLI